MKRLVSALLVALMLAIAVPSVQAQQPNPEEIGDMDKYEDAFSHPLRLAYYLMYPIGFTAEWLIMRPLHYIVSRPYLNRMFGYTAIGEEGTHQHMGERM
jgi:hypothetical protein